MSGALEAVIKERKRQDRLLSEGRLNHLASEPLCPDVLRLAALMEEVGEVARAVHDGPAGGDLRAELIQVAAVAVGWVEGLDASA